MAQDFMKLTQSKQSQSQIDALKKIGDKNYGLNGGRVIFDGTDLSIFQGDVENFKKAGIGGYETEQLGIIFGALDVDGNGDLSMEELQAFAAMGEDKNNYINDDKTIIDENDFKALYDMAQEYVDKALTDDDDLGNSSTIMHDGSDVSSTDKTEETDKTDKTDNTVATDEVKEETNRTEASLSDNEAMAAATELRSAMAGWGTDEATVHKILQEKGYNSADIVKIMNAFENQYGETLMHDIQGDFSGKEETGLRETLYNAVAQQAAEALGWQSADDIPDDIAKKANEFYSQLESADATGYMKDFDKLSDAEKSQIMIACDMLHPDESAMSRITEDRVWFGKEDGYVDGIISALKNTANSAVKEPETTETTQTTQKPQTTVASERTTLSDNSASAAATELRSAMAGWGTDEATVHKILQEKGYNSADIVKIMDTFEQQYGETLMQDIQGDFSGKEETGLRETLYNAVASEALKSTGWQSVDDIPKDIVQKANAFYAEFESSDATGYMKNFDKLSDSDKSQIILACELLHPGEQSVMSKITEGRVWFGKEDGYVDNIIKALKNTANQGI